MKKALTIAGSDSCGGAGIQADLKTFSALGVYGMSVITAITAQNTQGVIGVEEISPEMVGMQMDAVFQDIPVDAVKVGMVSNIEIIEMIGEKLKSYHMEKAVVDTVMVSKSGCHLLRPESKEALIQKLIPQAYVVTPNLHEAEVLTGRTVKTLEEMQEAAKVIYAMGPKHVIVKGGHLEGKATDVLYDGQGFIYFEGERVDTKNTHGTGCTFASAIAAHLALGCNLVEAVEKAKSYITMAIAHSFSIGKGVGPTHHFYQFYPERSI
ncbi:hydroxymethylpyrimidine/phosphomethylpyrimidine kinase [Anaerosolibacter carboniphilus]|uniref:Hydroxymethylpyrimidine/phosphomethylpyrimidine kinase n=1 Tax=Anaerosolibacter carboniphilus TaxID=1417629 RepID=A0A841KZ49_9FIRM|nr:bifunctional hydroxymethylpyrimidine kinase/phosphomethylpyrimidine kinase [Anaerosolibacter carboniphilus]MBB6217250.1 hydroxymethylpyrimidine/phosphomethylpyrimidine kinase [Anaerosolibacter carboniphilus]